MPTAEELLGEATRIGRRVLNNAERGDDIFHWSAPKRPPGTYYDTLYHGAGGIALFLIELFRVTQDQQWLDAAKHAIAGARAVWSVNAPYSFITGSLSVTAPLIRLYEVLGDSESLTEAARVASSRPPDEAVAYQVCDYINGAAGVAGHLLHVYALTNEPAVLQNAKRMLHKLVDLAGLAEHGVYWDRSHKQVRPLAGVSHGAIGIGTALLEASVALGADGLSWLANEAARYDESLYVPSTRNWPNYTVLVDDEIIGAQLRKRYGENSLASFHQGQDMAAWCHGATGIAMARLRFYERTGDESHKAYALLGIARTVQDIETYDEKRKYNPCHGAAGSADLLLEARAVLGDAQYTRYASRVAALMLDYARRHEGNYLLELTHYNNDGLIDNSLFTGLSGIGYGYLRIYDPATPMLLLPRRIPERLADLSEEFDGLSVRARVGANAFPRLHWAMSQCAPDALRRMLQDDTASPNVERVLQSAEAAASALPEESAQRLKDVVALESRRAGLDATVDSNAFVFVDRDFAQRCAAAIGTDRARVARTAYQLSHWARLTRTRWPWPAGAADRWKANLQQPEDETAMILMATPEGVRDMVVGPFAEMVLQCFASTSTPEQAARKLATGVDADFDTLLAAVIDQVLQASQAAILVPTDRGPNTTAPGTR